MHFFIFSSLSKRLEPMALKFYMIILHNDAQVIKQAGSSHLFNIFLQNVQTIGLIFDICLYYAK